MLKAGFDMKQNHAWIDETFFFFFFLKTKKNLARYYGNIDCNMTLAFNCSS